MPRLSFLTILFFFCSCAKNLSGDYVFPSAKDKATYIKSYDQSLKLWKFPFEEVDIPTSFGTAHVITSGPMDGEPLVLLHGTDASSTMWFPNIAALGESYRIYAVDYPLEAGKSVSNRKNLSNKEVAAFYGEVFDHFKMKDINLAGVSRGGWMATFLAVHHPTKIKKLVLLSPAQAFTGLKNPVKVFSAIKLKLFPSRKNSDLFFKNFSRHPEKIDSVFQSQLYYAYKYGRSKPGLLQMGKFSDQQIKSLKIPILILIGDHDIVNGEKLFEKVHRIFPNIQTVTIQDAGHFLSIDQHETVNKIMKQFLKRKNFETFKKVQPLSSN